MRSHIHVTSGNSLELPIDGLHPAPAAFRVGSVADDEVGSADFRVPDLAHHLVRIIPLTWVYLAENVVADRNISNIMHRAELDDVTDQDAWVGVAVGPERSRLVCFQHISHNLIALLSHDPGFGRLVRCDNLVGEIAHVRDRVRG